MVDTSRKMNVRNGIETTVDNDRTFWLNEKHKEEVLDHKICRKLQLNIIQLIENIDMNW